MRLKPMSVRLQSPDNLVLCSDLRIENILNLRLREAAGLEGAFQLQALCWQGGSKVEPQHPTKRKRQRLSPPTPGPS